MLLPFTSSIELLLKNRRWLWISPVLFALLIVASRVSVILFKDSVISYFAGVVCVVLGCFFLITNLIVTVNYLFDRKNIWCEEVSSFHSIGYGFKLQIWLRFLLIFFVMSAYTGLFLFISSIIPAKSFLLVPPVILCFVFFRLLGLWLGFSAISYIPVILFAISFFYPVYLLPSPVFILKGALIPVFAYIFVYTFLYLLVDVRFSYYTWRDICIGWIF
jgi:hypothetical protein